MMMILMIFDGDDDVVDYWWQTDLILLGRNLCHTDNRADCTGEQKEQKRQKERGKKEQLGENKFKGDMITFPFPSLKPWLYFRFEP